MAEVVVLTAEATVAFTVIHEPVASAALSVVDVPIGRWTHERVDEQFTQEPILLGRQFEQGFPAFTQAHPLQVPVLLHLQHAITRFTPRSSTIVFSIYLLLKTNLMPRKTPLCI